MTTETHRASRALYHARFLAEHLNPRGANTPEERRAAEYVLTQYQASGVADARIESFRASRSGWLPVAIVFSMAVWGSVICWGGYYLTHVVAIGAVIGAGLCLAALWLIYRHFTFKDHPLRRWLARESSYNTIGRVQPTAEIRQRVVLVANLDSPPDAWIFRTPRRARLFQIAFTISFVSLLVSVVMFVMGALEIWGWAFVTAAICGFLQGGGVLLSILADQGDYTLDANANASGLSLMLALMEQLSQAALTHTEVWLLACGSHTTDSSGLRAFLDRHRRQLGDAWFVGFDRVGVGQRVVYLDSDGGRRADKREVAPVIEQLKIAAGPRSPLGRPTPIRAAVKRGYRGLCLTVQDDHSAPRAKPLQTGAVQLAYQTAWQLLQILDQ